MFHPFARVVRARPAGARLALSAGLALALTAVSGLVGSAGPATASPAPPAPRAGVVSVGAVRHAVSAGTLHLAPAMATTVTRAAQQSPNTRPARELWVWQLGDPGDLATLARTTHVSTLLVWVSPGFSSDPATMQTLNALHGLAASDGLELQALCGDQSWVSSPALAGTWAAEVARTRLFSGLHLDIEPASIPSWTSGGAAQTQLAQGFLTALRDAAAAGLPLEADIPAWFDQVEIGGQPLDTQVLTVVAGITIMAYQDSAPAVLAAARAEVHDAAAAGKYAYIGVNLAPTGGDAPDTTMLGQPAATIAQSLVAITAGATGWPGFRGLALHDAEYVAPIAPALAAT